MYNNNINYGFRVNIETFDRRDQTFVNAALVDTHVDVVVVFIRRFVVQLATLCRTSTKRHVGLRVLALVDF